MIYNFELINQLQLEENKWHAMHDHEIPVIIDYVNTILSQNTTESVAILAKILFDKAILNTIYKNQDLMTVAFAICICQKELQSRSGIKCFIHGVNNIPDLKYKINTYKFAIFNLLFNVNYDDAFNFIIHNILSGEISTIALTELINTYSFSQQFADKLIFILKDYLYEQ